MKPRAAGRAGGACLVQAGTEAELACTAGGAAPTTPHAATAATAAVTILLTFMLAPLIAGDQLPQPAAAHPGCFDWDGQSRQNTQTPPYYGARRWGWQELDGDSVVTLSPAGGSASRSGL